MSKLSQKLELLGMKDLKPVPRNPYLRSIEGEYSFCSLTFEDIPYFYDMRVYCKENGFWENGITRTTPRGMKISRALIKDGKFNPDDVSKFMKCIVDAKFYISCKFNDIIRLGVSRDYSSCMHYKVGMYKESLKWYLLNPDIAIAFTLDRSGQFQSRATLISTIKGIIAINSHGRLSDLQWLEILKGQNIPITLSGYSYSKVYYPDLVNTISYASISRGYDNEQHKLIYN